MNNFSFGGGGKQRRDEYIGGRPKSDADYGPKKKRFDKKPGFGKKHDRPNYQNSDRQLFKTNCTTCGKPCEVPFRPDGTKPVLCRDCFAKNHPADRGDQKPRPDFSRGNDRDGRRPEQSHAPQHDTTHFVALTKQVATLEAKLDEVLTLLRTAPVTAPAEVTAAVVAGESTAAKKPAKKVAKKAAAPKKATKKTAKKAAKKTKK